MRRSSGEEEEEEDENDENDEKDELRVSITLPCGWLPLPPPGGRSGPAVTRGGSLVTRPRLSIISGSSPLPKAAPKGAPLHRHKQTASC
jgi:hypothetical protein